MKFKEGKAGMAIVVDEPLDDTHGITAGSVTEYYGGYVVCESVWPSIMPMLLAAPDLLAACQAVLIWSVTSENEPTGTFSHFAEVIVPQLAEVIAVATQVQEAK